MGGRASHLTPYAPRLAYLWGRQLARWLALALLAACAPAPAPDLAGWQTLYARPGWAGGAAVDLRAVGDVMLARHVAEVARREGPDALLADVRGLLGGDLAVGNLEGPLTDRREGVRPGPYRLLAPPELAAALPAAGFDVLGLSNNHSLDGGSAGLADTIEALRAAGVAPVGAGPDESAALAPAVVEARGLRVAVLALNDVLDPADGGRALAPADDPAWPSPDFPACPEGGACPHGRAWLSARALAAVTAAQAEADAVVALVHWGVEYVGEPSARQRAWAARLVSAGADLVLGAHPHVLQPAEPVEAGGLRGFVAYSLGNFLFDGPADLAVSSGAALRVLLDREGVALVAAAPVATSGGRAQLIDIKNERARAMLGALGAPPAGGGAVPMASAQPTAQVTASPPAPLAAAEGGCRTRGGGEACGTAAWRWDGSVAQAVPAPADAAPPANPARVAADLRGDGEPLWAELDGSGVVTVRDGPGLDAPVVWANERPGWRFTQIVAGDPNDDGRVELLMLLWQPDAAGRLRSQPYLLGWRGGRYRIIWGGSPTGAPVQDLAVADLDADGRSELVALEGGEGPGDPGEHVSVWRWHGWGFQLEWRSPPGRWGAVGLLDVDGDGGLEIVAGSGSANLRE